LLTALEDEVLCRDTLNLDAVKIGKKKVRVAIIQFHFVYEGEWHRKRVLGADTTPWAKLWTLIMLAGFTQWIMDALRGSVGVSMFVCLSACLSV